MESVGSVSVGNETVTAQNGVAGEWPLWRVALRKMRAQPDYGYGAVWKTEFFEEQFCEERASNAFNFAMLALRQEIEKHDGYYLRCHTEQDPVNGTSSERWSIPSRSEHESVAQEFESRLRSYGRRAVRIRTMTLENESQPLSNEDRGLMEASLRIASTRLLLIQRERSVARLVRHHKPALLEGR